MINWDLKLESKDGLTFANQLSTDEWIIPH